MSYLNYPPASFPELYRITFAVMAKNSSGAPSTVILLAAQGWDGGSGVTLPPPLHFCLVAVDPQVLQNIEGFIRVLWISRVRRPSARSIARGGGRQLFEEQLQQPGGICRPSAGTLRAVAPSRRDCPHWDSCVTFAACYCRTTRTNCLKCINAAPEECFIIEVIAVFSRLMLASGVD